MFPDNEGFVPTMRVLTLCSGEDCRLRSLNVASSLGGGLQVFKGQEKFFPILLSGPAGFFAPSTCRTYRYPAHFRSAMVTRSSSNNETDKYVSSGRNCGLQEQISTVKRRHNSLIYDEFQTKLLATSCY